MKLTGNYAADKEYQVDDVVMFDDGSAYRLEKPAKSGVPPVDTAFWTRLDPMLSQCAKMILSCMVPVETKAPAKKKGAAK